MLNKQLLKTIGPGILFACTAIGVSHLVQSTQAGANYGFALLWAVLLANVFKYPFFEFGSRYANATGESIIDGYKRIGKWMLVFYFLITLGSMFFVTAAVTITTAGFLDNLFHIGNMKLTVVGLFIICVSILIIGRYAMLDNIIKVIGTVLLITTIIAFTLTLIHGPVERLSNFKPPEIWNNNASLLFLIALMGWMPTAVDLSAWNSLWTLERIKQTGYKPSMKQTLFDFNAGYVITAFLAICFVTLGAYLNFGSGIHPPEGSVAFSAWVIDLYTTTIGGWSYFIIAGAAFSIMFSTSIAVMDGYSRSIQRVSELLLGIEKTETRVTRSRIYTAAILVVAIGGVIIIFSYLGDMTGFKKLVNLATTISFLIAPVIAVVNFRLVTGKYLAVESQPPLWLKILSWMGIAFLLTFSVLFLVLKFY